VQATRVNAQHDFLILLKKIIMSKWLTLLSLLMVLQSIPLHGQEGADGEGYIHRDFQFTFMLPPLGTNGIDFARVVNCFSINTFAGFSAGNQCMELGGFVNMNKAYMRGSQIAGFANVVGLVPAPGYNSQGIQVAGFANYINGSFAGAQIAGFANISRQADSTMQLAGFANVLVRGEKNSQAAGFLNVGEDISGLQAAGFANIAKNVTGIQVAGFINIADSIQGIPLGFINVVRKNGYSGFEISGSDFNYFQFIYKMGTPWLYNIYSAGKPMGDLNRWTIGLGIGTTIPFDELYTLKLEVVAHQELFIGEDRAPKWLYTDRLNMVNQVRAIFSRKIIQEVSVFLAPTFNVGIASDKGGPNPLWEDLMPYWKITPVHGARKRIRLWFGFSGGISF